VRELSLTTPSLLVPTPPPTDFNNLGGYLPEEFCCMPCLKHISMANNNIGGDILTCLVEIPTLESIEFVGNDFGTTAEVRMKHDEPLSPSSPP